MPQVLEPLGSRSARAHRIGEDGLFKPPSTGHLQKDVWTAEDAWTGLGPEAMENAD
ncbi:MAG: hypothetical protein ACREIR_02420 [Geminicoccaceae bacterium]